MGKRLRSVRVDDAVWQAAREQAQADGVTVSAVIVAALEKYVHAGK